MGPKETWKLKKEGRDDLGKGMDQDKFGKLTTASASTTTSSPTGEVARRDLKRSYSTTDTTTIKEEVMETSTSFTLPAEKKYKPNPARIQRRHTSDGRVTLTTTAEPLPQWLVDKLKRKERRRSSSTTTRREDNVVGYRPRHHHRHTHQQRRQDQFERYVQGGSIHDDEGDDDENPYSHLLN